MTLATLHAARGRFNLAHGAMVLYRNRRSERILEEMVACLEDEPFLQNFWGVEFGKISTEELKRARWKLLALLSSTKLRCMLSQTEDMYDIAQIADSGGYLVVNSSVGALSPAVTGMFSLGILRREHDHAMSRLQGNSGERKARGVFTDEAHFFTRSLYGLSDPLRDWRKANYWIWVSVQSRTLLSESDRLATSEVGTHIVFGCSPDEAKIAARDFRGRVDERAFQHRKVGAAFVRMRDKITNIQVPPLRRRHRSYANEFLEKSRSEYCLPISEAKERVRELWAPFLSDVRRDFGQFDQV